ncbi:hypothetical protein BGX21_000596 [Mortierella sp. AD011]|nr:hypothetical protein BGX21_000596 [Mortierella sp. AD011]
MFSIKSASVAALAMLLIAVTVQAQETLSVPPRPRAGNPLSTLAEGSYPKNDAALEKRGYTCDAGYPLYLDGCSKTGTGCGCGLGEECNGGCCDLTWSCDAKANQCTKLVFTGGSGSGSSSSSGINSLPANALVAAAAMAAVFAHV